MGKELSKTTSIRLHNENSLRIDNYLLDCYALKKYGTIYEESKKEVNADIRTLHKEHNLETVREVKYYLTLSFLSRAQRAVAVGIYGDPVKSEA